jgi:hypothetical protein
MLAFNKQTPVFSHPFGRVSSATDILLSSQDAVKCVDRNHSGYPSVIYKTALGARGWIILSSPSSRYTCHAPQSIDLHAWIGSVLAFQRPPNSPDFTTSNLNVVCQFSGAVSERGGDEFR